MTEPRCQPLSDEQEVTYCYECHEHDGTDVRMSYQYHEEQCKDSSGEYGTYCYHSWTCPNCEHGEIVNDGFKDKNQQSLHLIRKYGV